jgi:hypothetical protein
MDAGGAREGLRKWRVNTVSSTYCWLTVNVRLAIVTVPVRGTPVAFGSTVPCTPPSPEPSPLVMVIHGTWLTAFQLHPAAVLTAKPLPVPPVGGTVIEVGLMEYVHPDSWVTFT